MYNDKEISYLAFHSKKATELINSGNLKLAQTIVNELLEKYPEDIITRRLNARILLMNGKAYLAKEYMDDIKNNLLINTMILIELNDIEGLKEIYYKYYYNIIPETIVHNEYKIAYYKFKIYLEKILGVKDSIEFNKTYLLEQLENYSFDKTLEHIIEHHVIDESGEKSMFRTDIDIKELLNKVKLEIEKNPDKKIIKNFQEMYFVSYPNVGIDACHNILNYIMVISNYMSSDIINMYPVDEIYDKNKLLYLENNTNKTKIKRKSQIDKFYERYNK